MKSGDESTPGPVLPELVASLSRASKECNDGKDDQKFTSLPDRCERGDESNSTADKNSKSQRYRPGKPTHCDQPGVMPVIDTSPWSFLK